MEQSDDKYHNLEQKTALAFMKSEAAEEAATQAQKEMGFLKECIDELESEQN